MELRIGSDLGIGLLIACAFAFVVGVVLAFWPMEQRSTNEGPPIFGDSYKNYGQNYGHMGPVHIGKQEFTLSDGHIRQVLAACPVGLPVTVTATGTQKAFPMQERLASALKRAGYDVTLDSVAMLVPPPEAPLTINTANGRTTVIVAPNA
jgi:hypothetical protein